MWYSFIMSVAAAKILLDGSPDTELGWDRALTERNYEVHRVVETAALLEQVRQHRPDLLVLDIVTLNLAGPTLLDALRHEWPALRVIVATTNYDSVLEAALARGANDFVCKADQLWSVVGRMAMHVQRAQPVPTRMDINEPPIKVTPLPELYHAETGRLDASQIAVYLKVSLAKLVIGLGAKYRAAHKTPHAVRLQPVLEPIARTIELLREFLGDDARVRAWLNRPHPDLSQTKPLKLLLDGQGGIVVGLLEDARNGHLS
jgi:DNA-binding response OmpR family regulator